MSNSIEKSIKNSAKKKKKNLHKKIDKKKPWLLKACIKTNTKF